MYVGRFFPMNSVILLPLFKKLETTTVEEPKKPITKVKAEEGAQKQAAVPDEWDRMKYMAGRVSDVSKNKGATECNPHGPLWSCVGAMQ